MRFDRLAGVYDRFRPDYPAVLLRHIARGMVAAGAAQLTIVDAGSGTGIFTRQLAALLPPGARLIGLEPGVGMRERAEALHPFDPQHRRIEYRDAPAEAMPLPDATVSGVVAATAAHWFDRPRFYDEARRVLSVGGFFCIVEYVRDVDRSPAAAAVRDFLAEYGSERAYDRPDYRAELSSLPGFCGFEHVEERCDLVLTPEDFAGLALSSSHARRVLEELGRPQAEQILYRLAETLASPGGTVPFGYLFQAFTVRRS